MPFWITPKKSDSKLKRSNQYLNTLYLTRNGAKAIDKGNIKILKLLIENGSDPNMIEKGDLSPLNRAIFRENFKVVEFLIENGADVNMVDGKKWTLFKKATNKGNIEIVRKLLQKGANPNIFAEDTACPLNRAIFEDKLVILTLLIENGADVDMIDGKNWTRVTRTGLRARSIDLPIIVGRTYLVRETMCLLGG